MKSDANDTTGSKRLKIVKDTPLTNSDGSDLLLAYDETSAKSNVWQNSTLKAYLDGDYYNSLSTNAKRSIGDVAWNVGGSHYDYTAEVSYSKEKETLVSGKVGLISASDFGFAAVGCDSNTTLINLSSCPSNWLTPVGEEWTMSAKSDSSDVQLTIYSSSFVTNLIVDNPTIFSPTVYLNTNVKIMGNGTNDEKAYKIVLDS